MMFYLITHIDSRKMFWNFSHLILWFCNISKSRLYGSIQWVPEDWAPAARTPKNDNLLTIEMVPFSDTRPGGRSGIVGRVDACFCSIYSSRQRQLQVVMCCYRLCYLVIPTYCLFLYCNNSSEFYVLNDNDLLILIWFYTPSRASDQNHLSEGHSDLMCREVTPGEGKWLQVNWRDSMYWEVTPGEGNWLQVNGSDYRWREVHQGVGKRLQVLGSNFRWREVSSSVWKWFQAKISDFMCWEVTPGEGKWL